MKKRIFVLLFAMTLLFSCKAVYHSNNNNNNEAKPVINPTLFVNLSELQAELHTIADNNTQSVVSISTEKTVKQSAQDFDPFDFFFRGPQNPQDKNNNKNNQPKDREFKQGGLGSGVIYQKKGDSYYVITNNHVIEGVDKIKVIIDRNRSYDGKVLATDPDVDIAVVEIKTKDDLVIAKFGDSEKLKPGDFVIAIGNPFGLQGTMTFGIISALGRGDITGGRANLTNFIQTDAAINPGNSGGALLNLDGEVIGINTLIYSQTGGNIGIGFAIPVNIAKKIADQIIKSGKVEHGWLGIYFEELTEETIKTLNLGNIKGGMLVQSLFEGSPAEKAGIKPGDVLLELDGKQLLKGSDLTLTIGNYAPGQKVKFKVLREDKVSDKEVALGDRADMKTATVKSGDKELLGNYGIELAELNDSLKSQYKIPKEVTGVLILNVTQRSQAAQAGLDAGDVIYKINDKKIKSITDVKNILTDTNKSYYFFINRKGKEIIIRM